MANNQLLRFHKHLFITLTILLVTVAESNAYLDNLNKPCKFLDSINITDGSYDENDESITYDGVYYTKNEYAEFDYEFLNKSYRQPVASHIRGCACKSKHCVRLCCPRGQILNRSHCYENESVSDLSILVTDDGTHFTEEKIFNIFNYVVGKHCREIYPLEPSKYEEDKWILFRNGSVLKQLDNEILSKNDYCFNPMYVNDTIELSLMTCFIPATITKDAWLSYGELAIN